MYLTAMAYEQDEQLGVRWSPRQPALVFVDLSKQLQIMVTTTEARTLMDLLASALDRHADYEQDKALGDARATEAYARMVRESA